MSNKKKRSKKLSFELYMDGVDFQHELGECETKVYDSVERAKKHSKCWESCGIVKFKAEVSNVEWVVEQDLFNPKDLVNMSAIPRPLLWIHGKLWKLRWTLTPLVEKAYDKLNNFVYGFGKLKK